MKNSFLSVMAVSLLCSIFAMTSVKSAESAKPSLIEQRFQQFDRLVVSVLDKPDAEKAAAIARSYRRLFANEAARTEANRSAKDLSLGFRAASQAAFYTLDERYLDDMSQYLALLEAQRQATPAHYTTMYGAFVQTRRLDDAAALYARHGNPEMEPLPPREQTTAADHGPREWTITERGALSLQPRQAKATQIIVVAHPSCAFTRRAVADLKAAPGGSAWFFAGAHWLTPQDRRFGIDTLRDWNRQHPDAAMSVVYKEKDWRELDTWNTPTFYFIKDGRVVRKIVGWPGPERVRKVTEAAGAIGISEAG